MEKLKKISLGLILMLCICFSNKSYAVVGCNATITAQKQEITVEDEFTVTLSISNIQGENGILVLGGVLEYDKNVLTLIGRNTGDMWSLSYNGTTGQFVADRDGFAKNNQKVITFKFKAIKTGNTSIAVKNLLVTDAEEEKGINGASTAISIKAKNIEKPEEKPEEKPGGSQGGNQGGNNNQGGNTNQGGNSNQGNKPSDNNSNNKPNENTNNENNINQETNTNGTVSGIENRVPEQNTANNSKPNFVEIEEEPDYPEVKLYKHSNTTMVMGIVCGVGAVLVGIVLFVGKKMIEKAKKY